MKARIVTFDIENMANLLWSWQVYGGTRGWNAIDVEFPWHIFCFAAKWYKAKTQIFSINDYKGYKPFIVRHEDGSMTVNPPDEYDLMLEMRDILDEADIVVGWNSKRFDVKKVQSKMIALGISPPSPFKQVDVMQEKKKLSQSNSNKLDDTGEEWGTGRKLQHEGWPLWIGCAEGDLKAWSKMKRYCVQDVNLTEKNYLHLRPWMANHPNVNHYSRDIKACSACGKAKSLIYVGWIPAGQRRRRQYRCLPELGGCGKFCLGRLIPQDPDNRLIIVK